MNKAITSLLLSLLAAAAFAASPTDITYTEGDASVRYARNGRTEEAVIGDKLDTGDMVKTGSDGRVEMDQKGVTLKVSPGTVFTLMERERSGSQTGVVSVALGSLKMRYAKLTGREPLVQTASCVAGVRGTELTVFAGADGSSLIAVDSGEVDVEAGGKVVELAAGEGVEVKPGQAPGDKFVVRTDILDYSKWNQDKLDAMLSDPLGAIDALTRQMTSYVKSVEEFEAYYKEYGKKLSQERRLLAGLMREKGKEAEARKHDMEVVVPLAQQTGNLLLNVRFYSLSALSLRRYVAGRMYVLLKSRNMGGQQDAAYEDFLQKYKEFLATFNQFIIPYIVEADI